MTPFNLYMPPQEAIVICTIHPDWHATTESNLLASTVLSTLQRLKNPVYLILDMTQLSPDMHDITVMANEISRGQFGFTDHPFVKGVMFVSPDTLIALTAQGMRTPTFGHTSASAHHTLEDALDCAREMMRA